MSPSIPLSAVAASLLLLPSALGAGLYTKDSAVINVDYGSYDSIIGKTNHTSIVEFYAPWCGHCQNLKPAYEKAAKNLAGLAKVAAINCDDESNKPFCGSMGVQGFPTLKLVKPGRIKDGKKGKPVVEDYQGARTAKAIVDAVVDKIPNHVKRLTDKDYEAWLEDGDGPKAVLFSDKGSTSATLKAISVDFLGAMNVAQIRDKEKQAVEVFAVEKFPTLVLLPGDGKDPVIYDGEMKKAPMVAFLSQAVSPNPDPAPKKAKAKSTKDKSKSSKQAKSAKPSQTLEDLEDDGQPTASPSPNVKEDDAPKPVPVPETAPPIPALPDRDALLRHCLNSKASTCVLVLHAASEKPETSKAAETLSEIHYKHVKSDRVLFPFYQLFNSHPETATLRSKLGLSSANVEIIAVNGKRGWYRHYTKAEVSQVELEEWIDAIRMGDGSREKLPEDLVVDVADLPPEPPKLDMNDPVAVREAMEKMNFQEGVDFEMEEIDDAEYERLLKEASEGAKARKAAEAQKETHDEL